MDNAYYYNTLSKHLALTATCRKNDIFAWLKQNGIPVQDDCLKVELVEIIKKIAPVSMYALDEIVVEQGYKILGTPLYHPELQPIEICWAVVKNQIARNCDLMMSNLQKQLDKAFDSVTVNTCSAIIEKVRKIEDQFWYEDIELDQQCSVVSIHVIGAIVRLECHFNCSNRNALVESVNEFMD